LNMLQEIYIMYKIACFVQYVVICVFFAEAIG
jgi:hypothetical protein